MSAPKRPNRRPRNRLTRHSRPIVEPLEDRLVLSSPNVHLNMEIHHAPVSGLTGGGSGVHHLFGGWPEPVGYFPDQVRAAYGVDQVMFGNIVGDGTGQTIAIVDAYDNPKFVDSDSPAFANSDLAVFDSIFGLPDPPSFKKVGQDGSSNLAGLDPGGAGNPNGTWEMEEALDIEWAHAIAPMANIVLVEANSDADPGDDLWAAVRTAASLPGVTTVSMSFGLLELAGETAFDSNFVTPANHPGVTFLAATGDSGSPGCYPAYSPNVLTVGGTTLGINEDNSYGGEDGWSGSGGGTSIVEPEPAYQLGVQSTGRRSIPDVAFDADANSGVAIYDSFDNTDGSGAWFALGGTSLGAPAWAALIAIANQGRVAAGGDSFDGVSQTLPYLYQLPASDFHDITTGSNGGFKAGPGYDLVTGLGSPKADTLLVDLAAFGTSSHLALIGPPPPNLIAGDSFGIVLAAQDDLGHLDPAYNGTAKISLASNPGGATLGGTLTAKANRGIVVFDGLTIDKPGSGYKLKITDVDFPTTTTGSFNVTTDPHPWAKTYFPAATDASLRNAIAQADSNGFANNFIVLSAATYGLTNTGSGQLLIQNNSALPSKVLTIVGQGPSQSIIAGGVRDWHDRIVEVLGTSPGSISVSFQDMGIAGGNARDGGTLGGTTALGGGLLVVGANVVLTDVALNGNQSFGQAGTEGNTGPLGGVGGKGGTGHDAQGGGIYLASGTLTLRGGTTLSQNVARGGSGGFGGQGATGLFPGHPSQGQAGGAGGVGGVGGVAAGGGIYVAGGQLVVAGAIFSQNQAIGGPGGPGGDGGGGAVNKPGGKAGSGGAAGLSSGGALYLAQGSITLNASLLQNNAAIGGVGGRGGRGGAGGSAFASFGSSISGTSGGFPTFGSGSTSFPTYGGVPNADGGDGGKAGAGAVGRGGGAYIAGGTLTIVGSTLDGNQAIGGAGGRGGAGGNGAIGSYGGFISGIFGSTSGTVPQDGLTGGRGGDGGNAAKGSGGGLYVAGGAVTLLDGTLRGNAAVGGSGGSGGSGGAGAFASTSSLFGGGGGFGGGTFGSFQFNPTGGDGGNGGNGSNGVGGGLYINGGSLTLINATLAANTAVSGASGSGGIGGPGGSFSQGAGSSGFSGLSGDADAGGLYVGGGTVTLDNSTVAFNSQDGSGIDGVDQVLGTVNAASTIFAGNGSADVEGNISANHSLFQTGPVDGTITGTANLVGVDPKLDPNGLMDHGGPTLTISLLSGSPAFGKGSNPKALQTDQRGFGPRAGSGGVDIGAYQHNATADTGAPTIALGAPDVTSANAATESPYTFTLTFNDNLAIAAASIPGASVRVITPGGGPPIAAVVIGSTTIGAADGLGDAPVIMVTYQIQPPTGAWSAADNGTYTIVLDGGPVADLAGNPAPVGTLGTFSVTLGASEKLVLLSEPPSTVTAGKSFKIKVEVENAQGVLDTSYTGTATIAIDTNPSGAALLGMTTVDVVNGVATFNVHLNRADDGYTLKVATGGLDATTTAFDVVHAAASKLMFSPNLSSVVAGDVFGLAVTVTDAYGNIVPEYSGTVAVALAGSPSGITLVGKTTATIVAGVATFSNLELDGHVGLYALTASVNTLQGTTPNFHVTPGAFAGVSLTTEPPDSLAAGSTIKVRAAAVDRFGNVVKSYTGTATIALASNPSGTTLMGKTTVDIHGGVATFNVRVTKAGAGYTLKATIGTYSVTTDPFDVVPGVAKKLVLTTQPPSSVGAGDPFGMAVTVTDAYGNIIHDYSGTVVVALATNPGGSTLGGTLTVPVIDGVASFNNLTLNKPGTGYQLMATLSSTTVTVTTHKIKVI